MADRDGRAIGKGHPLPPLLALLALLLAACSAQATPGPPTAGPTLAPPSVVPGAAQVATPTTPPSPPVTETAAPPTPSPTIAATAPPTPSPSPTATPTATPTPRPTLVPTPTPTLVPIAAPVRLLIPTIGVNAVVEPVGLTADGAMGVPGGPWTVGWYQPGPPAGEFGNAVIAGHVDYRGVGPAVFWRLRDLAPGDEVVVLREDGTGRRFVVIDVVSYPADYVPLGEVFSREGNPGLSLITCTGQFDSRARDYDRRLVVYAEVVGPPFRP